jgi:hypothetical protein
VAIKRIFVTAEGKCILENCTLEVDGETDVAIEGGHNPNVQFINCTIENSDGSLSVLHTDDVPVLLGEGN